MKSFSVCQPSLRLHIAIAWVLSSLFAANASPQNSKVAEPNINTQRSVRKEKPSPVAMSVDLNNASGKDLDSLPGVGPATVKKIIDHRPYQSVDDLTKAGLTAKEVDRLRPMVTIGKFPVSIPQANSAGGRPVPTYSPSKTPATRDTPAASPASPASPAGKVTAPPPSGSGMVWVNTETKVFHREGDPWYGKTKRGSFMTEAAATQAGYRAAKH